MAPYSYQSCHQPTNTMALNAPGKHYREGIGIVEIVRTFSTEKKAYDWLASHRWPDGGRRPLGIPTVADRVAQMVVKRYMEPEVARQFHPDS